MTNKRLIAQARELAATRTTTPWGEQVVWTLLEMARALEKAEQIAEYVARKAGV